MLRSLSLVSLGFTALFASTPSHAQTAAPGAQCRPAVENPSLYHSCRLRIVNGSEICRCRITAGALNRNLSAQPDGDTLTTGSIGRAGGQLSSGAAGPLQGAPFGSGNAAAGGNSPALSSGSATTEQDNAGLGNGWESSDVRDYGGASAVVASGIDTSRGDPDNPGHNPDVSPGNSGSAGKSGEAPGHTR
ncbi:hypothetical protein DC522_14490 [Microvirga sp. KLBC 81]|uniref:hypothetical protein n=1 Tax=Microvirga sp. KLBC 81 TaxID=1862707 RepID=UPI000D5246D4|nr:hypothetical protein [Microvirga sp. KLBC 81]PVE23656.1 hypothetical protein DC522_14490 [Microvirga sp. KLBC 81]